MEHDKLISLLNEASTIKFIAGSHLYFEFSEGQDLVIQDLEREIELQKIVKADTINESFGHHSPGASYYFWKPESTIYQSLVTFLNTHALINIANNNEPDFQQLVFDKDNEKLFPSSELREKTKLFKTLWKVLENSGAYITDKGRKPHFFISVALSKSMVSELTINFKVDSDEFINPELRRALQRILIPETDPHKTENRHILKKVIGRKFLEKRRVNIDEFVSKIDKISSLFDEEFSVYLDKFGLDEFLNKVSEKRIEINSKISSELTGTTSKFVGVPITLGLTMLVRTDGDLDFYKILVLLLVSSLFFLLISYSFIQALNAHKKDISRAEEAFTYEKSKSENADRAIEKFNSDLYKLVDKSRNIVIVMLLAMFVSFAFWLLILDFNSVQNASKGIMNLIIQNQIIR